MNDIINKLAMGRPANLDIDGIKVPVRIDTLKVCSDWGSNDVSFNGYIINLDNVAKIKNAPNTKIPNIKTVHFSGPVTVVIWEDKTKTIVRCNNENVDYEKGLAMAIAKKMFGTNKSGSNYYDIFKKWLPKIEEEKAPENVVEAIEGE